MKSIVNTVTGKFICCVVDPAVIDLGENEMFIPELPQEKYILTLFDFQTRLFYEGATPEESHEANNLQALESETNLYLKRINDGINAVARLSAELRLAKLSGQISEEVHKSIDALLVPIRNEVLAGQWIGAKDLLIELGSAQVGENLYDKLLSELNAYINENY